MNDGIKYVCVAAVMIGMVAGLAWAANERLAVGDVLPIQPDTDTYTKNWCGLGNPDFYVMGGFDKQIGAAGDHNGEVFERSTVWYAWTQQGESFPVIADVWFSNCGVIMASYPPWIHTVFWYTEDKKTWVGFGSEKYSQGFIKHDQPAWEGWVVGSIGVKTFTINGYHFDACTDLRHDRDAHAFSCMKSEKREIRDGAILRVEVWGGDTATLGGYTDTLLASDELQLRSAIPYIHAVKPRYKVGETAQWDYRVPTTTTEDGQPAYFVQIIDCNTNQPLAGWDKVPVDSTSGKVSVIVTEAMISNDLATCQNRLRGILWSELIVAAISDASLWSDTTIETGMTEPVIKSIKFDKDFYFEGDVITLTWEAEGNITKFHVTVDVNGMIVLDDDVSGTVRSATVSAARAGTAQAQITPYNKCFTGDVKRAYAVISGAPPEICEAYPDLPMCKDAVDDWVGLIISILALVFLGLSFVFFIWLFSHYDIDLMVGLLMSAVIVLVMAIVLIGMGAFDYFLGVMA